MALFLRRRRRRRWHAAVEHSVNAFDHALAGARLDETTHHQAATARTAKGRFGISGSSLQRGEPGAAGYPVFEDRDCLEARVLDDVCNMERAPEVVRPRRLSLVEKAGELVVDCGPVILAPGPQRIYGLAASERCPLANYGDD